MGPKGKRHDEPLVDLAPSEVQHLLRPRKGWGEYTAVLAALYRDNLETMRMKGFDPDAMIAEMKAYDALEAAEHEAELQLEKVRKTRLLHASNAWTKMLAVYARARSAARTDPVVMRAIARFAAFMKHRPRAKHAATTIE